MSAPTTILQTTCYKSTGICVMARVYGDAGTAITQASLSGITYAVYEETNANAVVVASTALTVSSVVYDALQTSDPRWTVDSTGYNFAHALSASAFPNAGRFRVEYVFTPASGSAFVFVARAEVLDRLSS